MDKVYLLTTGDVESHSVIGAFSSKEDLEEYASKYCEFDHHYSEFLNIEEYEIDDPKAMRVIKALLFEFTVDVSKNFNITRCVASYPYHSRLEQPSICDMEDKYLVTCFAQTKEEAQKIAINLAKRGIE